MTLKDIRFQIGGNAVVPKKKNLEQTEALRTVLLEVAGRIEAKKNDREKNLSYTYEWRILSLILKGNFWFYFLSNTAHRSKMDSEQRKRITSNITFLKERLGYMDPILDRLVEKNVLTMEQRERIEKVQPPTPHKKFNEFIQFLLASPDPGTFPSFIASLEDERYFNIVERLQKDGMFYQTFLVW